MYATQGPNSLRHVLVQTGGVQHRSLPKEQVEKAHRRRVFKELRQAGMSRFALQRMESRYLPKLIHPAETIGGVVYGMSPEGYAMLVATDIRVMFLDRKPLFTKEDEVTFDVVSGVSFNFGGIGASVTLHTRIQDFTIRTFNKACAERFVEYIEARCVEHTKEDMHYDPY